MYLGEVAPAHMRGNLGAAFLLTAVTGMLISQVLGLLLVLHSDQSEIRGMLISRLFGLPLGRRYG